MRKDLHTLLLMVFEAGLFLSFSELMGEDTLLGVACLMFKWAVKCCCLGIEVTMVLVEFWVRVVHGVLGLK